MPVLFWIIVATSLFGIGFAAWKLAKKVDKEERELIEWIAYIEQIRRLNPDKAQYLEWMRETGQENLYYDDDGIMRQW